MFEPLSGGMGARPIEANHVGKEFFGKLVTQREALGFGAALGSQSDSAVASDMQQAVARHSLERGGHGGRRDAKLLGKTRADGRLLILEKFPDGLEVVFP